MPAYISVSSLREDGFAPDPCRTAELPISRETAHTQIVMRFKRRPDSPLAKRARKGFGGYPIATLAFYGPVDWHASKVAVGIVRREGDAPLR
jgi:hypothetical protein